MLVLPSALAISAALLGSTIPARNTISLDSHIEIPIETGRVKGVIWLKAQIEGKPVTLLLDTGAGHSYVVPKFAKRLGLAVRGWPDGERASEGFAEATVKIGPITHASRTVHVMDLSYAMDDVQKREGMEFAGLLGCDILHTDEAILDFRSQRLYLRDSPGQDHRELQGTWRAKELLHLGQPIKEASKDAYIGKVQARFDGDRFEFQYGTHLWFARFSADPCATPKELKLVDLKADSKMYPSFTACYEFEGNRLRLLINVSGQSPTESITEMKSTAANRHSLWTFERIRPESAPAPRLCKPLEGAPFPRG